ANREVWGIYSSAVRVTSFGTYTAGVECDVTTLQSQVVPYSYSIVPNGVTTAYTAAAGGETALSASGLTVNPTSTALLIFTGVRPGDGQQHLCRRQRRRFAPVGRRSGQRHQYRFLHAAQRLGVRAPRRRVGRGECDQCCRVFRQRTDPDQGCRRQHLLHPVHE